MTRERVFWPLANHANSGKSRWDDRGYTRRIFATDSLPEERVEKGADEQNDNAADVKCRWRPEEVP